MIWTLSGFLGLASDWDLLPWPHGPLVLDGAEEQRVGADDVVIGYSMGGRLALRLLESARPRAAVIVSAGLNAADPERLERDDAWARRFESDEPWEAIVADWQAQPVFGGHKLERGEGDYDRRELARELREYSPAALPPPDLSRVVTRTLWVVGEEDAKYVAIGRYAVERLPNAELWVCPGAGHRVPWQQPERFVERLRGFLQLH